MSMQAVTRVEWKRPLVVGALLCLLPLACMFAIEGPGDAHRWWAGHGPVVPHDNFPADCSLCHTGSTWHELKKDFDFDHLKETGVALVGAHQRAECLRCHNDRGSVAVFAQQGCKGCHEDIHRGNLGGDCVNCHNEESWQPLEQVAKHNETRFPLIGAHSAVACFRCHPGAQVGNFTGTDTSCETCHQKNLAQALSPNHVLQGWVQDCEKCHRPTHWRGSGFVHATFPLIGSHASVACADCHVGGVFKGTSRNCEGCHLPEYIATTNPNHQTAGFPTSCETCHSPFQWQGGTFNHNTYPLTGAHTRVACIDCHVGGVFAGTSRNCSGCHLPEYNATTNPNHQTAGFPTSCESCHDTSQWQGANFNHNFPIRGPHNVSCVTCHTVLGNFKVFDCLVCHAHNKTRMDSKHKNKLGYVYSSPACLSCHPKGKK